MSTLALFLRHRQVHRIRRFQPHQLGQGDDAATLPAYEIAQQLEAGHVGINATQRNHEAPFGGRKMSGVGRDGVVVGMHADTEMTSTIRPG